MYSCRDNLVALDHILRDSYANNSRSPAASPRFCVARSPARRRWRPPPASQAASSTGADPPPRLLANSPPDVLQVRHCPTSPHSPPPHPHGWCSTDRPIRVQLVLRCASLTLHWLLTHPGRLNNCWDALLLSSYWPICSTHSPDVTASSVVGG